MTEQSTKKINIAIVGATGLVGGVLRELLEKQSILPINKLYLLASEQSAGQVQTFKGETCVVENLAQFDFSKVEIAFFAVSQALSQNYIPKALASGCLVIDKSVCYRQDPSVPLLIPEVNPDALQAHHKLIANPNCNTLPVAVAVQAIYREVGIESLDISTYQSVSGTGKDAVNELQSQIHAIANGLPVTHQVYAQQIALNVLPCIDSIEENGYTAEEMKMVNEIKKILNDDQIRVNPTAVRVPVFYGHGAAVHLVTKKEIALNRVFDLLEQAPGVCVMRDEIPTPLIHAQGSDAVFVGRVRKSVAQDCGLNLWVVSDNLRKGAALNALQSAQLWWNRFGKLIYTAR